MEALIQQIRESPGKGLFYLGLLGALALPDICASLSAENGRASGPKYKRWVQEFVPGLAHEAEDIYGLRCALLHQGQTTPKGSPVPLALTTPGGPQLHKLSTDVEGEVVGWLSVEALIVEITAGADRWLQENGETRTVQRNLEKFAHLRPGGYPRHGVGLPVIWSQLG